MKPINWYNPEQNVFGAIARAQNRGDVVAPFNVPPWLLGVAPGTPALPLPDAGQVSFRGNVRRPNYAQTVQATFGYGDAGACCLSCERGGPCESEAGALGDQFERVRQNFLTAASVWGWNMSDINAVDWSAAGNVREVMDFLIGMVAEFCGVPYDTANAALTNAAFSEDPTALRTALYDMNREYCPELAPAVPESTVQVVVGGDECPAGETMTDVPVFVNGVQVGTSTICAPLERLGDETETNGEKKEEKNGYPVWGYYVAGGVGLLALGGVAYYATRNR